MEYGLIISEPSFGQVVSSATVQKMVQDISLRGYDVGVSMDYMVKFAETYHLTENDLAIVLFTRKDFEASIPYVGKLLDRGVPIKNIVAAYAARFFSKDTGNKKDKHPHTQHFQGISLIRVVTFLETFPEFMCGEEGEGLWEAILDLCNDVMSSVDFVHSEDMVLDCLCVVADKYDINNIDAAVALLTGEGFSFLEQSEER